ncbi:hypothetical protein LJK87_12125 [Paenibacillus sp. P25]|nr:hypothetical protein LJK87_12125 [Paenibacillus sp. P25]
MDLSARQKMSIAMTPQLQQSIESLQLSSAEVAELIVREQERNPMLDLVWNDSAVPSRRKSSTSPITISPIGSNSWPMAFTVRR